MLQFDLWQNYNELQSNNTYNNSYKNDILDYLLKFEWQGNKSSSYQKNNLLYIVNEFWTSKQRQGNKLHEISYRACFKSELPEFFINLLTKHSDVVYDPFMGRGTTLIQSQLMHRKAIGNDINPISLMLTAPRLNPPQFTEIEMRLNKINLKTDIKYDEELLVFYHPQTLIELTNLRQYFLFKQNNLDIIDNWIKMVALNRLTGHSNGFFSGFTMPPNQAISVKSQQRINEKRNLTPPYRDIKNIILKKSKILLSELPKNYNQNEFVCYNKPAHLTNEIQVNSIDLIITSPPFLDIVNYAQDNWLRAWFAGIDINNIPITKYKKTNDWTNYMRLCFSEFFRTLKPNGHIVFEVGELQNGKILLEDAVIEAVQGLQLEVVCIMINQQNFTKTANIWGINNNNKGTNTNRMVILRKTNG